MEVEEEKVGSGAQRQWGWWCLQDFAPSGEVFGGDGLGDGEDWGFGAWGVWVLAIWGFGVAWGGGGNFVLVVGVGRMDYSEGLWFWGALESGGVASRRVTVETDSNGLERTRADSSGLERTKDRRKTKKNEKDRGACVECVALRRWVYAHPG